MTPPVGRDCECGETYTVSTLVAPGRARRECGCLVSIIPTTDATTEVATDGGQPETWTYGEHARDRASEVTDE